LSTYKQHLDLAAERFLAGEEQYREEKFHTAAHLFINSAINYNNALCQKFLKKIPSRKSHYDNFPELAEFLEEDRIKYQKAYEFLISHKSEADYGVDFPERLAQQVYRRANTLKEIAEEKL